MVSKNKRDDVSPSERTDWEGVGLKLDAWARSGLILLEYKRSQKWRERSSSFTAFVTMLARELGVQRSVLWRHLSAVQFYVSLGSSFEGLHLPALSDIQEKTNAENLELIQKISRQAPRALTRQLLQELIDGVLTRKALRNAWRIYRPTLGTSTLRGRKSADVISVPENRARKTTAILWDADALYGICNELTNWTGCAKPNFRRMFVRPTLPRTPKRPEPTPDLMALIRKAPQYDLTFHGVETVAIARLDRSRALASEHTASFFDYFWMVVPFELHGKSSNTKLFQKLLPGCVGLMQADRHCVRVIRRPSSNTNPNRKADLVTMLLAYAID